MRIKVPFEVAIIIVVGLVIVYFVFGMGYLATWLDKKFEKGTFKKVVRMLGAAIAMPGFLIANTFYFEQYQRDEIYQGLYKFDLGEVIVVTVLWAGTALFWFWSRWRIWGSLVAMVGGIAIFLKPILWPLISTWGEEDHTYGLTSETHLYFLLSGLGLFALGVILIFSWRAKAAAEKKSLNAIASWESGKDR
ncbi:MAG: hypothetical protein JRJ87_10525 [Deltaproteobacteria bacterium]|nr:hypothetical protein [Deltaproteobacteria bacterium]